MSQFEDIDDSFDGNLPSEPQSMSLMGGIASGGFEEGGFGTGVDEGRRLTRQSIYLGGAVTLVAFAAILGMRMTQPDTSANAAAPETAKFMAELDKRIAGLKSSGANGAVALDTTAIVAAINTDHTLKQVPVDQVQMNPFQLSEAMATPVQGLDAEAIAERERGMQLTALYAELSRIEVESLIGGNRPRAFIGGELYKIGDTVGSFRLSAIRGRRVHFDAVSLRLREGEAPFIVTFGAGN